MSKMEQIQFCSLSLQTHNELFGILRLTFPSPFSFQAIMRAFSREALEHYIPIIQEEVRAAVKEWLAKDSCVLVYPEMKRLMFRIAMRILLGFEPEQIKTDEQQLVEAFEEMIKNLFSLPIDVPFSGLYRVRTKTHLSVVVFLPCGSNRSDIKMPRFSCTSLKKKNISNLFLHSQKEQVQLIISHIFLSSPPSFLSSRV